MSTPSQPSQPSTTCTLIVAVVTGTDDISLQCTTSLLKLQQHAAQKANLKIDFHIVKTYHDALNMYTQCDYLAIIDGQCGFSPTMVVHAVDTQQSAVYGVYPLGKVDWARIDTRLKNPSPGEPLGHAGNVYNIVPKVSSLSRYVPIESVKDSKVMILKSSVIDAMTGPHTSTDNGHILWYDSSFENTYQTPPQTFFRLLMQQCQQQQTPVMADTHEQCTLSANAEFSGCVGQRGFIR